MNTTKTKHKQNKLQTKQKSTHKNKPLAATHAREQQDSKLCSCCNNSKNKRQNKKLTALTPLFSSIITTLGEDVTREGLAKTPQRAAHAFQYLTSGYDSDIDEVVNGALFNCSNSAMVITKNIELFSLCEHHLLPFVGKCHIGYLPQGKVLGLSKIARIADMFARRLQIQEHLTTQIAEAIMSITGASGVGVIIEAMHLCMMARGVKKQNAVFVTSAMLGNFRTNAATKQEFLSALSFPSSSRDPNCGCDFDL